ncbi:MAG: tyrosine-type recombinase/integrase [Acidimicrobiales bacterium]
MEALGASAPVGPFHPTRPALALPAGTARALREYRDRQGGGDGLVFSTLSGAPLDPSNVRREFARIAKSAGLAEGFPYLLRHSGASLMLDAGASLEEVADVLGDSPATLLRHYRHRVRPVADGSLRLAGLFEALPDGMPSES